MKRVISTLFAVSLLAPAASFAHDQWLEPSSTVLSGEHAYVTVSAGSGNDKFIYNHHALRLDNLAISSPKGESVKPENEFSGELRSGFDVNLTEDGTYRIAVVTHGGIFA